MLRLRHVYTGRCVCVSVTEHWSSKLDMTAWMSRTTLSKPNTRRRAARASEENKKDNKQMKSRSVEQQIDIEEEKKWYWNRIMKYSIIFLTPKGVMLRFFGKFVHAFAFRRREWINMRNCVAEQIDLVGNGMVKIVQMPRQMRGEINSTITRLMLAAMNNWAYCEAKWGEKERNDWFVVVSRHSFTQSSARGQSYGSLDSAVHEATSSKNNQIVDEREERKCEEIYRCQVVCR